MWLSRNTKVLDSFPPPQKWEAYACSMWSGYSMFGKRRSHHRRQKNYESHMIARIHNIAHVNCCKGTYFFLKQTVSSGDSYLTLQIEQILGSRPELLLLSIGFWMPFLGGGAFHVLWEMMMMADLKQWLLNSLSLRLVKCHLLFQKYDGTQEICKSTFSHFSTLVPHQ